MRLAAVEIVEIDDDRSDTDADRGKECHKLPTKTKNTNATTELTLR